MNSIVHLLNKLQATEKLFLSHCQWMSEQKVIIWDSEIENRKSFAVFCVCEKMLLNYGTSTFQIEHSNSFEQLSAVKTKLITKRLTFQPIRIERIKCLLCSKLTISIGLSLAPKDYSYDRALFILSSARACVYSHFWCASPLNQRAPMMINYCIEKMRINLARKCRTQKTSWKMTWTNSARALTFSNHARRDEVFHQYINYHHVL